MNESLIKPDPEKKPKRPRDANQLAKHIVDLATGQFEMDDKGALERQSDGGKDSCGKDPDAVRLGRKGGLKGGKARAKKLTAKARQAISRKAARARWNKS